MATIPKQTPAAAGEAITLTAAAPAGDRYLNSGKEMLVIKKSTAATATVTFAIVKTCNVAAADHDVVGTILASDTTVFPPLNPAWFNDADGYVNFTYSSESNLTVGLLSPS